MDFHARVVIVGGGMMGVGLLYHLALEGWTDSLLVEKGELTSGSTWHAAGQCPSFIGDYTMAKIHHVGNTLYPKLESMTGQYTSWHGCGGVRLATTQAELEWFKHVSDIAKHIGYRMEVVGPDEIQRINPFIDTTGVIAGAWTLDDGHVDPSGTCQAMAKAATHLGASIIKHNRVLDIRPRISGEWEVETERGVVIAEHVVNAAGCYARRVSQMVGSDAPIWNTQHQYFITEPIQEFIDRDEEMPVMRDPEASCYYRQEQMSALIGVYETAEAVGAWPDSGGLPDWDSHSELFEADYDRVLPHFERVMERMPIWNDVGIKSVTNGAIPHTPDDNPLLGPAGGLRNFWMCCGASIGIAQGAGCGKYLAQWMVHGDADVNMASLDPRRFGAYADEVYTVKKAADAYMQMYALHIPGEERTAGRPARVTPLYETLRSKGCVYTEAFGWERPKWFSLDGRGEDLSYRRNNIFEVVAAECQGVTERVGVIELSSFAKFDVSGPDAESFLNRVFANRMPKKTGGIKLAHRLGVNGRIQSEVTVTRITEDLFYILSGSSWEVKDFDALSQAVRDGERVTVENVTDRWGNLIVAGPRARDLLSKITEADLGNDHFRWLTGKQIEVAGVSCRALRVNYVGELGWELHHPMERMCDLYSAIEKAGEEFGLVDFGASAVDSMRIEKGYRGIGADLTNEISPIEAGLHRFVPMEKEGFIGREALLQIQAEGVGQVLVNLDVETHDADCMGGEPIFSEGEVVGVTSSGAYGHRTGRSLALAYVKPGLGQVGQKLEVDLLEDRCLATVLGDDPVFDPENRRLRA
ncbi:MAG: aminomethyltransferase [Deltaproteobacteria bacterium]|nr:aminomethyltransferase [Deltaproteobacteria bacterium]